MMNSKAIKRQLLAAIAMVLVAALALGSSTYAWFVTNTKVTASSATVSATAASTLLIKNENNEWATSHTFTDSNTNFVPVSTIGKDSTDAFVFYVQNDWAKDTDNKITVNKVSPAAGTEYWSKEFEIKASQACNLYLDEQTVFSATGANNTMNKVLRLALVVSKSDGTFVDTFIYQIDPQANSNPYNTTLASLQCEGINKAVSGMTKAQESDTFGTPTAGNLVSAATKAVHLDGGTGKGTALATSDSNDGLNATVGTADVLYKFTQNNEVCKIKAYIWMEGCDFDCTNDTVNEITGRDNVITATLGFCAGQATT